MRPITTPDQLIRRLGGAPEAAQFFGVTRQCITNWKNRTGHLPPRRYYEQREKLKRAGIRVHRGLWFPDQRGTYEKRLD